MPRVSVIIPALNAEDYIQEALDSVRAQTFDDWEIVVVDDGSSDRTAEIAEAHDSKPTVIRNASTVGGGAARNTGIATSSGELIALLDADDYWLEAYLDQQVTLYDAQGGGDGRVGVVACDARILSAEGFLPHTYMEYVECPDEVGLRRLLVSNPIYGSVLMSRAAVREAGGFTTFAAVDHDLWLRLAELGYRIVVGRRVLAVYRIGSASVSSSPVRMARYEARVYERALTRGNLNSRERRLARRALRQRRAIERVFGDGGISSVRVFKALPLLALVVVENPQAWRSIPRIARRGLNPLAARFEHPVTDRKGA